MLNEYMVVGSQLGDSLSSWVRWVEAETAEDAVRGILENCDFHPVRPTPVIHAVFEIFPAGKPKHMQVRWFEIMTEIRDKKARERNTV